MFKVLAISAVFAVAGACQAGAVEPQISASPKVEWRGAVYLTAVSGCPSGSYAVGNMLRLRYSPNTLGGNDTKSRLSFFQDYFGQSYVAVGTLASGSAVTASGGYTGGGTSGSFAVAPTVTISSLTSPLLATTKAIAIEGTIANFYDTAGCTVSFRGSGALRP